MEHVVCVVRQTAIWHGFHSFIRMQCVSRCLFGMVLMVDRNNWDYCQLTFFCRKMRSWLFYFWFHWTLELELTRKTCRSLCSSNIPSHFGSFHIEIALWLLTTVVRCEWFFFISYLLHRIPFHVDTFHAPRNTVRKMRANSLIHRKSLLRIEIGMHSSVGFKM